MDFHAHHYLASVAPQPLAQMSTNRPETYQISDTTNRLPQITWSNVLALDIHPIVGIAATFLAKHVLVAILASG